MTYQVTLAVNGNHSVSVTAEDEAEVTAGLVWAKRVHERLSTREPTASESGAPPTPPTAADQPPDPPPFCGIHQVAMVWQRGRRGHFWSCHERTPDGRWCTFKPITPPAQEASSL